MKHLRVCANACEGYFGNSCKGVMEHHCREPDNNGTYNTPKGVSGTPLL